MMISIEKKIFSNTVHTVSRFADKKNMTLPALSSVLIIGNDEGIKMRATNLETGIDWNIQGVCTSQGVVAVPALLLQQIAGSLSQEGSIELEQVGDTLLLKGGTGKSSIKTVPYEDFPSIPFPENPENTIVISGTVLKNLFSSIATCASPSTVRPELASIYLSIEGGQLTVVATDSFRLAEKKVSIPNKGTQGKILIPAKNALDIAQALSDAEVTISFDEHQCSFTTDQGVVVSRLTNSIYPDYRQIIPKESVVEVVVLRKDFENALKRTAIFSDMFQKVRLGFDPKKNQISLFAKNSDIGESSETLSARVSGDALELSFNHRYLTAFLSLTNAESISLIAAGVGRPLRIIGVGDASLLYLVSPMNQ